MTSEGIVAVVTVRRIEDERALSDVLATSRFDEAIESIVGIITRRIDPLAPVENGLRAASSMRVMLPTGS